MIDMEMVVMAVALDDDVSARYSGNHIEERMGKSSQARHDLHNK